jgi:hypothetical protein
MTPAQKAIKQLQSALVALEIAGIRASVAQLHGATEQSVAIIIPGVELVDGRLEEK